MRDEKELYSLLIQNPEKGLEEIMEEYMAFVYTIAHGKLSGVCAKQDIEECVSDVFYKLYKTRDRIDLEKGSLKSYLGVISKRTAIDVFRRMRNTAENIPIDGFEHDWIASDVDIEQSAVDSETNQRLIQEIHALGEPDSQIIIRKYYLGQTSKVISKAMGIKENTVNKKVSRALGKLKQALGGAL